jgi:LmbE family N-acetylglucosaminyl deacetylase
MDDSAVERILFVTAHPDDLDFGAGGTIAQWTDKGIHVSYCVCTNGDQGGVDPSVDRTQMPKIRQQEQRDAGAVLGVSDIHFLNYVDGHLVPSIELRKEIVLFKTLNAIGSESSLATQTIWRRVRQRCKLSILMREIHLLSKIS